MAHKRALLGMICFMALTAAAGLAGCGGDTNPLGGAAGWVYQPEGGGQPIISASPTPPAGYVAVPHATASVVGYPELTVSTGSDGGYLITSITPGTQTLVVQATGQAPLAVSIPIIANQITLGSGHQEGGGGIG